MRLTERNSQGIAVLVYLDMCDRCGETIARLNNLGEGEPIDKLAQYEDLGLEPDQLKQIDTFYLERCQENNKIKAESLKRQNEAAVQTESVFTQLSAYVCDELCKQPSECKSQEQLNDVCARCRMEYFEMLLKKAIKVNADV